MKDKNINNVFIDLLTCCEYTDSIISNFKTISNDFEVNIRLNNNPIISVDEDDINWCLTSSVTSITSSVKSLYFNDCVDSWNAGFINNCDLSQHMKYSKNMSIFSNILLPNIPQEFHKYVKYHEKTKTYKVLKNFIWPFNINTDDHYFTMQNGEIFDGCGYTIWFGELGNLPSYGIFTINCDFETPCLIKNLKIRSTIVNDTNNNGTGGFIRNCQTNFKIFHCHHIGEIIGNHCGGICSQPSTSKSDLSNLNKVKVHFFKCSHTGNMNGICNGGIIGGGMFGNLIGKTINVRINKCHMKGTSIGDNCGGICGAKFNNINGDGDGCFANYLRNSLFGITINDCHVKGILTGNNCGGICAGSNNNGSNGSGCFGNCCLNSTLSVNITNCHVKSILNGNNCGGMCAGGDTNNISGFGGGCFGNCCQSSTLLVNITNCHAKCILNGNNCGGMCGGGNNNAYYNFGGGCFGNGCLGSTLSVNVTNCHTKGTFNGNNCGGICGGGDNNGENDEDSSIGSGCFGNCQVNSTLKTNIIKCSMKGNIEGNNCAGICAGGNNYFALYVNSDMRILLGGGGCFGNFINYNDTEEHIFSVNIVSCENNAKIKGSNCGGICAGSNSIGCFLNNLNSSSNSNSNSRINVTFLNCKNSKVIEGYRSGGICSSGICLRHENQQNQQKIPVNIKIKSCSNTSHLVGQTTTINKKDHIYSYSYSGGILAGNINAGVSSNMNLKMVVKNCYSKGIIAKFSSGIVGKNISTDNSNLTIKNCYVFCSKINSKAQNIAYKKEKINVKYKTCYYGKRLKKITRKLGKLPKHHWEKTNELPILKN